MAAAVAAARKGAEVTIAESNSRVGKKLLMTGNGRCNLSHLDIKPEDYNGDTEIVKSVLERFGQTGAFGLFMSMGVLLNSDSSGRVYPYSNSANTVLDALREELDSLGVKIFCDTKITAIERGFTAHGGIDILADRVILTTGGKAQSGSDGYALAKSLGHSVTELSPSLCGITADGTLPFKGIRAHAAVTLCDSGKNAVRKEIGEIQFTEWGLSGICVFDIAGYAKKGDIVIVDLLPDYSEDEAKLLLSALDTKRGAASLLGGIMNKRLTKLVKCDGDFDELAHSAKNIEFTVKGTRSFSDAQVTKGGIPLDEVGADMQSKKCPGLYFAGEILDVDGGCGGYNLHWAWASGVCAGENAAE